MVKKIILNSEETCSILEDHMKELGLHVFWDANGHDTPTEILYAFLFSNEPITQEQKDKHVCYEPLYTNEELGV